jgi:hypothetical protein
VATKLPSAQIGNDLTSVNFASGSVNGAAGVPGLRSLGTGPGNAMPGNATPAPSAHALTHKSGGSDPVGNATPGANVIAQAQADGTLAEGFLPGGQWPMRSASKVLLAADSVAIPTPNDAGYGVLSITLPAPGTYLLWALVRCRLNCPAGQGEAYMQAYLFDTVASTRIGEICQVSHVFPTAGSPDVDDRSAHIMPSRPSFASATPGVAIYVLRGGATVYTESAVFGSNVYTGIYYVRLY